MNDFFDPNEQHTDAEIVSALRTLPEPPAHADSFWAELDAELDEATPSTPPNRLSGRTQFLLVAAALVVVAGVIGIVATNQTTTVDVAQPLTTTTAGPATTAPDTATSETAAPSTTDRYVSEIFRYDVAIPDGAELEFQSEQGLFVAQYDGEEQSLLFQIENYFTDEFDLALILDDIGLPRPGETIVSQGTVEVPLYTEADGVVTPSEASTTGREYVFRRGVAERAVRAFEFDDRLIVAWVEIEDPALVGFESATLLDGIRLYDGPIAPPTTCSAGGLPPLDAPAELNDAQRARFDSIMAALVSCDWALLEAQIGEEFFANIAGTDPMEFWRSDERYGGGVLRVLYDHLGFPVGFMGDASATWPRGWDTLDGPDAETLDAMLASNHYTRSSVADWREIGYYGWRVGIDDDGTWSYFLIGD